MEGQRSVAKVQVRAVYHFREEEGHYLTGDVCSWRFIEEETKFWTNSKLLNENNFCDDCEFKENRLHYLEINNEQ